MLETIRAAAPRSGVPIGASLVAGGVCDAGTLCEGAAVGAVGVAAAGFGAGALATGGAAAVVDAPGE